MAFSTYCTNKGCGKHMEPYLDSSDDKVYCSVCDNEIPNITHFAKMQMKTLKQFKKKTQLSFSVKCKKCNKEDRPKIVNNDVQCPYCKVSHTHLSEPFKIMLREKLKTADQDI